MDGIGASIFLAHPFMLSHGAPMGRDWNDGGLTKKSGGCALSLLLCAAGSITIAPPPPPGRRQQRQLRWRPLLQHKPPWRAARNSGGGSPGGDCARAPLAQEWARGGGGGAGCCKRWIPFVALLLDCSGKSRVQGMEGIGASIFLAHPFMSPHGDPMERHEKLVGGSLDDFEQADEDGNTGEVHGQLGRILAERLRIVVPVQRLFVAQVVFVAVHAAVVNVIHKHADDEEHAGKLIVWAVKSVEIVEACYRDANHDECNERGNDGHCRALEFLGRVHLSRFCWCVF